MIDEEVRIDSIGRQGDGVAETADGRVHVAYTLPGERVRIRRDSERGTLLEIIEPSLDRIAPVCKHFGVCGGCALQHWADAPYLAWKRDIVVAALNRAGVEAAIGAIEPQNKSGRWRAVFHAGRKEKPEAVGFAERRSHRIVEIEECPVLSPELEKSLPVARELAAILAPTGKPLDLHFTHTGSLDIDIRGPGKLPEKIEAKLVAFAAKKMLPRISLHGVPVTQVSAPGLKIGRAFVKLPPGPFLQATHDAERALGEKVLAAANGAKTAMDLFCGIGTFALRLAEKAKVAAFDSDLRAIAALNEAAKAPGLKPVNASVRDLFRWPLVADELKKFDFVVLDPPRQGAEAQCREIAKSKLRRLAYVSCDADTFARDAKILRDAGFALESVTPVDQFRYSPHVEVVGVFAR